VVEDCFPAVDYFEERAIPFLVAVNHFAGARRLDLDEVREPWESTTRYRWSSAMPATANPSNRSWSA
jgi:hypothetical protein